VTDWNVLPRQVPQYLPGKTILPGDSLQWQQLRIRIENLAGQKCTQVSIAQENRHRGVRVPAQSAHRDQGVRSLRVGGRRAMSGPIQAERASGAPIGPRRPHQLPDRLGVVDLPNEHAVMIDQRYRHVDAGVPDARRRELAAQSLAFTPDPFAQRMPTYQRMLFLYALYDIALPLEHSPLIGCTSFAFAGAGGHELVGRAFDFEAGEVFDRDKVVYLVREDGAVPFASVAWPGFIGVVTGMNAEGVVLGEVKRRLARAAGVAPDDDRVGVGPRRGREGRGVGERARDGRDEDRGHDQEREKEEEAG